jgi:hypothetical protein
VTDHADEIQVANMSLGCECSSDALDTAITSSTGAGVVYVVAGGNSGKDAATFSPANHEQVITVAAMADFDGKAGGAHAPTCRSDVGGDDEFATFSNFGAVVEFAAPGVCINSTWLDGAYRSISGTSMASPHGAGAAALYIVEKDVARTSESWQTVRKGLLTDWTVAASDACGYDVNTHPTSSPEPMLMLAACDVVEPGPVTDVAVTTVSAPASVVQGETAQVDVAVENVGNQDVNSDITVTLTDDTDSTTIGTQTISGGLAAGVSTTLAYEWTTTTDTSLGDHILTATHDFDDDDASNNSKSTTVSVTDGTVSATDLWVADIVPSVSRSGPWTNVTATVTIENSDGPVSGAEVTFVLERNADAAVGSCGSDMSYPSRWTLNSKTDSSGQASFQLKTSIPDGCWRGTVDNLTHSSYTWNQASDHHNPRLWEIRNRELMWVSE